MTVESHLAGRIYSGTRAELINYMESVGYQHLPDAFKAIFQMGFLGLKILTPDPDIITIREALVGWVGLNLKKSFSIKNKNKKHLIAT